MRYWGSRASYQAITAFFFVIVLVSVILILVSNNIIVSQQKLAVINHNQDYLNSRIAVERIISCHGSLDIEFGSLVEECEYGPFLKSYTIEILPSDSCDYHIVEKNPNPGEISQALVYFVPVRMEESHIVCLGRLTVSV
ncbi:MAG: hypothetical protein ACMXYL_05115 [Candidatus Woesearchaeota archaeon]